MFLVAGCSKGQSRVILEEDQRVFTLADSWAVRKGQSAIRDSGYFLVKPVRLTKDSNGHSIMIISPVRRLSSKKLDALRGINNQVVHLDWSYGWLMNFLGCLALHPIDVPVVPYETYFEKLNVKYPTLFEQVRGELSKSELEKMEDQRAKEDLLKFNPKAELPESQQYIWKHCLYQGWFGMQSGDVVRSSEEAKKVWLRWFTGIQKGQPVDHKVYVWAHAVLQDILKYSKYFCQEQVHEDWWDLITDLGQIGTPEGMFGLECSYKFGKLIPEECPFMVMDWPKSGHVLHNPAIHQLEVECMYCAGGKFRPTLGWCLEHADQCVNAKIHTKANRYDDVAYADLKFKVNSQLLAYIPPEDLKSGAYKLGPRKKSKPERQQKVTEQQKAEGQQKAVEQQRDTEQPKATEQQNAES